MPHSNIEFLVFDVESVADGELISRVKYGGQGLSPAEAIAQFQDELREQSGRDFIPYTFQLPVAVVVAKIDAEMNLVDLVSLDEPHFRSHVMAEQFWRGWEHYQKPTWVTFNGRSFDLPLMELAAFRYGLNLKEWFYSRGASYTHPRNRYNNEAHLDLHELLTNYGATWFRGGLDLAAMLLGKPGKICVAGHQVQEMHINGLHREISDYCRCDVLDTYFVFLRCNVLTGRISLDRESELVEQTHRWLIERQDHSTAYQTYLENWGDWQNPWIDAASGSVDADPSTMSQSDAAVGEVAGSKDEA